MSEYNSNSIDNILSIVNVIFVTTILGTLFSVIFTPWFVVLFAISLFISFRELWQEAEMLRTQLGKHGY